MGCGLNNYRGFFGVLFPILFFLLTDDHSRVILGKEDGDSKSDYINASYIPVRIFLPLECLNNQEDDCSENVTEKMTLRSSSLYHVK